MGNYVLSVNDVPQDMAKLAEILLDPLHPDTDSKRLMGRFLKEVVETAQEHEPKLLSALSEANILAEQISYDIRFPVMFGPLEDPADLLRLFSFRLDTDNLDMPELLLDWMQMQREFFGKRLFILYGVKQYLTRSEQSAFYRNVLY